MTKGVTRRCLSEPISASPMEIVSGSSPINWQSRFPNTLSSVGRIQSNCSWSSVKEWLKGLPFIGWLIRKFSGEKPYIVFWEQITADLKKLDEIKAKTFANNEEGIQQAMQEFRGIHNVHIQLALILYWQDNNCQHLVPPSFLALPSQHQEKLKKYVAEKNSLGPDLWSTDPMNALCREAVDTYQKELSKRVETGLKQVVAEYLNEEKGRTHQKAKEATQLITDSPAGVFELLRTNKKIKDDRFIEYIQKGLKDSERALFLERFQSQFILALGNLARREGERNPKAVQASLKLQPRRGSPPPTPEQVWAEFINNGKKIEGIVPSQLFAATLDHLPKPTTPPTS